MITNKQLHVLYFDEWVMVNRLQKLHVCK